MKSGGGAAEPGADHADRHRDHPHDREAEHRVQGDAPVDELQPVEQETGAEHEPDGQRQDPPDQLGELGGLLVVLADAGPEREAGDEGGHEVVDAGLLGDEERQDGERQDGDAPTARGDPAGGPGPGHHDAAEVADERADGHAAGEVDQRADARTPTRCPRWRRPRSRSRRPR